MAKKNSTKSSAGTTANPASDSAPVLAPTDVRDLPPQEPASKETKAQKADKQTVGAPRRKPAEVEAAQDEQSPEAKTAELMEAFLRGDEAPEMKSDEDDPPVDESETPADETEAAEEPEPIEEEAAAEESDLQDDTEESTPEAEDEDEALEALAAAKKWPKSFIRKMQRERAKRRELESRLTELESRQPQANGNGTHDAPPAKAEQDLQAKAAKLRSAIAWLDRNRDGATVKDDKGVERELSAEDVQEWRDKYAEELDDARFELRAIKRDREAESVRASEGLKVRHPWMFEAGNPDRSKVEAFIRQNPEFDNGKGRMLVADGYSYQRLLERAAKAAGTNGKGAPAPPPPKARTAVRPNANPVNPVNRHRQLEADYLSDKPGADLSLVASLIER